MMHTGSVVDACFDAHYTGAVVEHQLLSRSGIYYETAMVESPEAMSLIHGEITEGIKRRDQTYRNRAPTKGNITKIKSQLENEIQTLARNRQALKEINENLAANYYPGYWTKMARGWKGPMTKDEAIALRERIVTVIKTRQVTIKLLQARLRAAEAKEAKEAGLDLKQWREMMAVEP